MINIKYLAPVWEDMAQIQDWYAKRMGPETARKVQNNIINAICRLSEFPNLGVDTPDEWLNELGYRVLFAQHHVVFYRYVDGCIFIYYIASTREDYMKNFYLSGRIMHEDEIEYDIES